MAKRKLPTSGRRTSKAKSGGAKRTTARKTTAKRTTARKTPAKSTAKKTAAKGSKRKLPAAKAKASPAKKATGRRVGTRRTSGTWALRGKGGFSRKLRPAKAGLRRYNAMRTGRVVKSTEKQKRKARAYYKRNKTQILNAAGLRYAKPATARGMKAYSKAYYSLNKSEINRRRKVYSKGRKKAA